jgi:hypothetical protein
MLNNTFNRQCFERNVKICEPLDIKVKKPRTSGRQTIKIMVKQRFWKTTLGIGL